VFFDCKLIADTAVNQVYLGRPWRPYAKTVFIRTAMGTHMLPAGWDNWKNKANETTAFYAEYRCTGPWKPNKKQGKMVKTALCKTSKKL